LLDIQKLTKPPLIQATMFHISNQGSWSFVLAGSAHQSRVVNNGLHFEAVGKKLTKYVGKSGRIESNLS